MTLPLDGPPCPRCETPTPTVRCLWDGVSGWLCWRCGGFWRIEAKKEETI
jgi:hypothetical protein